MTRQVDLIWVVLAIAATALGIWLGMGGPELSPIFTEAPFNAGGPGR